MGLDVKEKNFLKFIAKTLLPLFGFVGIFVYVTELWRDPVKLLGALVLLQWSVSLLKAGWLWLRLMVRPSDPRKYGSWAIVTGATAGIGEGFALDLASRGINLIIISRSAEKLEAVKASILEKYQNVKIKCIAYDFTDRAGADAFYAKLKQEVMPIRAELGILVNNVGTVNGVPDYMHKLDEETTRGILQVNIEGTVQMTRAIAPFLVDRRKGAIINVSSGSGNHPSPMITCYASTKAFITQFSQCMSHELREFGVDVLVITPYYVISNQFKRKAATYIAPAPETVVKQTFRLLGYRDKAFGYWIHAACGFLVSIYWDVGRQIMIVMKRNQKRALEAAAKKANKAA